MVVKPGLIHPGFFISRVARIHRRITPNGFIDPYLYNDHLTPNSLHLYEHAPSGKRNSFWKKRFADGKRVCKMGKSDSRFAFAKNCFSKMIHSKA